MPLTDAFTGRLPRSAWYPASTPGLAARDVPLADGEHARVVEGGPAGRDPVVFVHGWGCSAYYWRHLLPAVADTGRAIVAVDLRGHGGSSRPARAGAYTAPAMRDMLRDLLDALGLERPHVVAHSLGGGVSLDLAAAYPERVRSLALLAPVGVAPVRWVTLARVATPLVAAPLVPYAVPRWSIPLALRAVQGTERAWGSRDVDEYWAPTADPAFAVALRALLHEYRYEARTDVELGAVQAPVLAMWGARDLLVRSRASHARVARRPGWRSILLERAGHVLAEEVPATVLEALGPHLDDHAAT